jgi:hypothetical protein
VETGGTTGTTDSAGSSTLETLAGTTSFEVDDVTGSATASALLAETPPYIERLLK